MKLYHIETKKQMKVGDKPTVTADCALVGQVVEVQRIEEPSEDFPEGRIVFNQSGIYSQHLLPRLFGYRWVTNGS